MTNKEDLYKILKLKKDCSAKDIKDSYIELSKKYHPDKSKDKVSHAIFLKINEAYGILSKPSSRRIYDQHLDDNMVRPYHHYYENVYTTRNDASFWANRAKGAGFGNEPYYSIKGLKKVSNTVIVAICFAFAFIGVGVEFAALRKSIEFDQTKLRHDSARNQMLYEYAKKQAEENGNNQQIEKFKDNSLKGTSIKEVNEAYGRRLLEDQLNATADLTGK